MEPKQQNNQQQPDLTIKERLALKYSLKKFRKERLKLEKKTKLNQQQKNEEKEKMQECILETLPIFDIKHKFKDGKEELINNKNIKGLDYEESLEIFIDCIKNLQKII